MDDSGEVDTIVLGLDGLDSGLVRREVAKGTMPKTVELVKDGKMDVQAIDSYKLDNWTYPWTGQAWPTIYCGADEKYHGINVPGWQEGAVSFSEEVPDTIFDDISAAGLTLGSFRMAITFPARPVNGWMLSGFPGGGKKELVANEVYGIDQGVVPETYFDVKDKKVSGETDSVVTIANAEGQKLTVFDQIVSNSGHDEDVLFYGTQMTDKAAHRYHLNNNMGDQKGENDYWSSRASSITCTRSDDIIEHMIETYDPRRLIAISDHGIMRRQDNHSMRAVVMEYARDGSQDVSGMESILDFRDMLTDRLDIEQVDDVWKETDATMTDEEEEAVNERLEDLGYL